MSAATPYDLKSVSGVPVPGPVRRPVSMKVEARIARRRLWPATIVYGSASATAILFAVRAHGFVACLPWLGVGVALWTWVEYVGHRFVLHGIFPAGPGWWRRFLHLRFDHLHWHHHAEPWNGRHISGSLQDTAAIVLALAAVSSQAPLPAGWATFGSFLLSYVAEEWVHLSVHFGNWRGRYFRYIRRHHLYHHGARGGRVAFGLTSDAWDRVHGTGIPDDASRRELAAAHPALARAAGTAIGRACGSPPSSALHP
jgi:sterol desaturase/sphingolipid hydroxylase (fatty acid hydroxylase superfamily)